MKWLHIAPKSILLILATIGTLFVVHFLFEQKITRTYKDFINDHEFVDAFSTNNTSEITRLVQQHNLQYQHVEHGNITTATAQDLPTPQLITVNTSIAPGVLPESTPDLLNSLTPDHVWKTGVLYTVIPIFPMNFDKTGYIIYVPVWP